MKLYQYINKEVKITTVDGNIFAGIASNYTPQQDNDSGISSICIGDYELYENEISSIELQD